MIKSEEKNIDFLWQSFLNGDDSNLSIIYQQSINNLIAYGLKFTHDKELVQDSLQEVFIDLFLKKKKAGTKIKKLKPYLFVAVRNGIIKRIVKENRFRSSDIDDLTSHLNFDIEYSVEQNLIKNEISNDVSRKLKAAVKDLPPRQKEIIYLKFEEELEYIDIAGIMKISVESARKSMHRALLSLRKVLDRSSFQTVLLLIFKK